MVYVLCIVMHHSPTDFCHFPAVMVLTHCLALITVSPVDWHAGRSLHRIVPAQCLFPTAVHCHMTCLPSSCHCPTSLYHVDVI